MYKLLSYILVLSVAATSAEFPTGITRCYFNDSSCLKQSIQNVLSNYSNGVRALNLLPVDPLHVTNLILERNPTGNVNIDLKLKDVDLIGIRTANVVSFKGFSLTAPNEIVALVPKLIIKGLFHADGRILILPINGKGEGIITSTNLKLILKFNLKEVQKNGKTYLMADTVKLQFIPELVQYKFDPLFKGNKELNDSLNQFINENWYEIYKEMENVFSEGLSLISKEMINNVLNKYSTDELFI